MPPAARTLALFSSGDLLGRPIPAGHVVDDDHARIGPGSQRTRQVCVDLIAPVPAHQDRLCEHCFVRHGVSPPCCRLTTIAEGTPGSPRPLKCLFEIGAPAPGVTATIAPRFLTVPPPLCGSHEVQVIVVVDELYTFLFHGGFHPWIGEGLELDLPLAIVWRLEPVDDVSRVAGDLAEF